MFRTLGPWRNVGRRRTTRGKYADYFVAQASIHGGGDRYPLYIIEGSDSQNRITLGRDFLNSFTIVLGLRLPGSSDLWSRL